jgi:mitogen-activated protein kinase 1/3
MLTINQPYHDPQDEPEAAQLDPSFFDFDNGEPLSKEELKGMAGTTNNHTWLTD